MVEATILTQGLKMRPGSAEIGVALGVEGWTMEEVERLFAEMERDGVKLVLPMTGAGDRAWYPSRILRNQSDGDWIGRLFDLAAGHGMEVILSGVSYTYHPFQSLIGGSYYVH